MPGLVPAHVGGMPAAEGSAALTLAMHKRVGQRIEAWQWLQRALVGFWGGDPGPDGANLEPQPGPQQRPRGVRA